MNENPLFEAIFETLRHLLYIFTYTSTQRVLGSFLEKENAAVPLALILPLAFTLQGLTSQKFNCTT
jgi:hypothetical protein